MHIHTMSSTLIDTLTELSQAQAEMDKAWAAYRRAAEEAHYAALVTGHWPLVTGLL